MELWGGMGLNNDRATLTQCIATAKKFQEIARKSGEDIILSNHTDLDRSKINLATLAKDPVSPNTYVTSNAQRAKVIRIP